MSYQILAGDWIERLRELPDESVNCCVTSPPYWRQRDYGISGQLGLELTPEEYIAKLVDGFRDVRRVLRRDGVCWLNLGDKYASGGNGGGGSFMAERSDAWAHVKQNKGWRKPPPGYKDKDLVGIPWMAAFALRSDGWYLRRDVVWAKPNGMTESVRDRPTTAHEYMFLLTKNNDYWYDTEAARMPAAPSTETRLAQDVESQVGSARANRGAKTNGPMKACGDGETANLRSVWWVSPASYGDEHYAVMPERLAEICILAGCPEGGTVLDPFNGAGTTGLVATRLQRKYIGIELNPQYVAMAERRIERDAPLFNGPQPIVELLDRGDD